MLLLSVLFYSSVSGAKPDAIFECLGSQTYVANPGVKFLVSYEAWSDPSSAYDQEKVSASAGYNLPFGDLDLKEVRKGAKSCANNSLKEVESLGNGVFEFALNDGDCGGIEPYVLNGFCVKQPNK